jgi:16S rRNA processing protein RimM
MTRVNFPSRNERNSGLLRNGEPEFLAVGKIRRPHGLQGEMLVDIWTDFPERLEPGVQLYSGEDHHPVTLCSQRPYRNAMLLSFDGIDDPESAGKFRNQLLFVRSDDRPDLPEGEYYHHQLLGMQVVTEDDQVLGAVTQILQTGSNDVYVVTPETGREILLPAIDSVMIAVDLDHRRLSVRLIPGLEI